MDAKKPKAALFSASVRSCDDLMAVGSSLITLEEPKEHSEVFMEWKGSGKETCKIWPSKCWWGFWDATCSPDRGVEFVKSFKECQKLFLAFAIGVLQKLGIETPGASFFVASSFGLGVYQLMPADWEKLDAALLEFQGRVELQTRCQEFSRIEKDRTARGLPTRGIPTGDDADEEMCSWLDNEGKDGKGHIWLYDAELASFAINSLEEMAREERDALGIDSDSDGELEEEDGGADDGKSESGDEKEEAPEAVRRMRQEARALLEEASKLAKEHNAASAQRKFDRRFDNGRTWVQA
jgi:hypothetical protein